MIISNIAQSIFPYRKLLVGFSGGLDSTVLLHCLKIFRDQEPNVKLRAIHVHHGLNSNADIWAQHCITLCDEWNIPLVIVHTVISNEGLGLEAHARKARYIAFEKTLLSGESMVLAQNKDDQCETFLLALKRGSGPAGLSAMPVQKNFASSKLLRPLLNETRKSLEIWANMYSLHWIEDESNQDDRYDRNFLRLHVLPLLKDRWAHISNAIVRSAALCSDQENLLNELLFSELSALVSEEGALEIRPLEKMSISHRSALIRRWFLNQKALMPSFSMLERIWKEVAQSRRDAKPCIRIHGYDIRRFKGKLWRIYPILSCSNDTILPWLKLDQPLILPHNMGKLVLKNQGYISPPRPGVNVSIRFQASGVLHIKGRYRGRKLKKIWQEFNIPPWERSRIPLLFYGETLIAAVGRFITLEGWVEKNGFSIEREI